MASIDSVLSATGTPTTGAHTATKAQTQQNQFLQLLVAQLKGQNPLDPMDGTQFVSQLAQFSSLEELTGAHADLDSIKGYLQSASQQTTTNPSQIF